MQGHEGIRVCDVVCALGEMPRYPGGLSRTGIARGILGVDKARKAEKGRVQSQTKQPFWYFGEEREMIVVYR